MLAARYLDPVMMNVCGLQAQLEARIQEIKGQAKKIKELEKQVIQVSSHPNPNPIEQPQTYQHRSFCNGACGEKCNPKQALPQPMKLSTPKVGN